MYSDGSGWGAEAGGIFGFNCFTWSKIKCCLGKSHGLNWKATFFFNYSNKKTGVLTPFFFAGRAFGIGFVLPSYRFIQML